MADRVSLPWDVRIRIPTNAAMPSEARTQLIAEVRAKLENGELDSDLALVETALALIDGDRRAKTSAKNN